MSGQFYEGLSYGRWRDRLNTVLAHVRSLVTVMPPPQKHKSIQSSAPPSDNQIPKVILLGIKRYNILLGLAAGDRKTNQEREVIHPKGRL